MISRVLEIVFAHKVILLVPIILGMTAATAFTVMNLAPYYASKAAIWTQRPAASTNVDYNQYISPAQNQASSMIELMSTKTFVANVMKVLDGSEYTDKKADELRKNTFIYAGGNQIVNVEHRSTVSGEVAAQTVKAIIDEYGRLFIGQVKASASRTSEFYKDQLTFAQTTVEAAAKDLSAYIIENPKLATVDLSNPPASALGDLNFARLVLTEQTARNNYNGILENYARSRIAVDTADGADSFYQLTDEPSVPRQKQLPSKRSLAMKPMLGTIAGFMVSAGLFALFFRYDRGIRSTEELDRIIPNIPVVVLPRLKARRRAWPEQFVRVAAALKGGFKLPATGQWQEPASKAE